MAKHKIHNSHMVPMRRIKHIALLVETARGFGRAVLAGITRYTHLHGPWNLICEPGDLNQRLKLPDTGKLDGLIGRIDNPRDAALITKRNLPVVSIGGRYFGHTIPPLPSAEQIGLSAFMHFRDCGLANFAFYGDDQPWGRERGVAFDNILEQHGYECRHLHQRTDELSSLQNRVAWLRSLPTPIGILARDDSSGRRLIDACRIAGLSVPEEAAVLGVDNDTLLCELAYPSLSSVDLNIEQFGFEAARRLDALMRGETPTQAPAAPAPCVIARLSTRSAAIGDPLVAQAVRYIREHLGEGVRVPDILAHVPVSRKTLFTRFKKSLGRSPHEEILRAQLEKAQSLLREPGNKLITVATAAGFNGPEYLHYVFKKHLNITPQEYRRKHLNGG